MVTDFLYLGDLMCFYCCSFMLLANAVRVRPPYILLHIREKLLFFKLFEYVQKL